MGDNMVKFTVNGKIKIDGGRPFSKEVEAKSEKDAKEKVYALFGSQNRLKRTKVKIEEVKKQ